jgi:hypothetical protein
VSSKHTHIANYSDLQNFEFSGEAEVSSPDLITISGFDVHGTFTAQGAGRLGVRFIFSGKWKGLLCTYSTSAVSLQFRLISNTWHIF